MLAAFKGSSQNGMPSVTPSKRDAQEPQEGLKHFLDASNEALLEAERAFLSTSLEFLQVSLLVCLVMACV